MVKATVEYVGFRTGPARREYVLRSHYGPETREYVVGIMHAAFRAGRARYQDGPEICYLKVLRELEASENAPGAEDFTITDTELADYLAAHAPAARRVGFAAASAATPLKAGTERR